MTQILIGINYVFILIKFHFQFRSKMFKGKLNFNFYYKRSISLDACNRNQEKYFIKDKYTKLTRNEVFRLSKILADSLKTSNNQLQNEKIAVLCPNNYAYVVSLLATWLNGGVALGN
jgi:acyl-CoA synthetase (AMP-forming)/AMP-acid ligase II